MSVRSDLEKIVSKSGAAHLTLIDPAEQEPELAGEMAFLAEKAGTDGVMVGGSTGAEGQVLDETIREIKNKTNLPTILFPADDEGLSREADAVFFMSLLNSEDPFYITGAQRRGASLVKKYDIEPISVAYLIIEPGGTVGKVGKADLISRDEIERATSYALAAKYFNMSMVYLEAGSGAHDPVPFEMVKNVKNTSEITLITGGGIRTPKSAKEIVEAGADILVTGTLVEDAENIEEELQKIINAIKK